MGQVDGHLPAGGLAIIAERPGSGLVVLRLRGELDRDTEPRFTRCLREQLAAEPVVVVDLGGVTFLAARGVDVMVDAAARTGPDRVRLVGRRSDAVVRAFTAAGVLGMLDPHHDVQALLRALPCGEDGGAP